MKLGQSPVPTVDVEEAKRDVGEFGFAIVREALTPEQVELLRERLVEQAVCEGKVALDDADGGQSSQDLTQIGVSMVLEKGKVFHQILDVEPVHEVLNHMFGASFAVPLELNYMVSSLGGLILRKGSEAQPLHSDQSFAPVYIPIPLVANVYFLLTDFTAENGATRLVPGSHRVAPPNMMAGELVYEVDGRPEVNGAEVVTAEAPAGSALIWDGRTWHGAGANVSGDWRMCIGGFYCAPYLRQRENLPASLTDEVVAHLTDDALRRVGFDTMLPGSTTGFGLISPGHGRTNVSIKLDHIGELHA